MRPHPPGRMWSATWLLLALPATLSAQREIACAQAVAGAPTPRTTATSHETLIESARAAARRDLARFAPAFDNGPARPAAVVERADRRVSTAPPHRVATNAPLRNATSSPAPISSQRQRWRRGGAGPIQPASYSQPADAVSYPARGADWDRDSLWDAAGELHEPGCGCDTCAGPPCGPAGECSTGVGPCGWGRLCFSWCVPVPQCHWLEASGGAHGASGPVNRGGTGSFGFHEGFNYGVQICGDLGGQVGLRAVHSNFSGSDFTDDSRQQIFLTAGLFRRSNAGLQGGLVIDYLSDDWYAHTDLVQLRGELSTTLNGCGDLGFLFHASSSQDTSGVNLNATSLVETFEPTDVYAVFYRQPFGPCGAAEGRLIAGFSGSGDGLIGVDTLLPIHPNVALEGGFRYLVPEEPTTNGGTENESWNVYVGVVWRPGCGFGRSPARPLFRVADNGDFFVDRR